MFSVYMERFARKLYQVIHRSQDNVKNHKLLTVHNNTFDSARVPLLKLPANIYEQFQTTNTNTNTYMPRSVIGDPRDISDMMVHFVRILPESGTRIDIYFLDGKMCVKNYDQIRLVNTIELYVSVLERLAKQTFQTVTIALYPSSIKKQMDFNNAETLSANHVNSGVTTKSGSNRCIIVYRYEEIYKVILHELLHYYDFDYYEYDNHDNMSNYIKSTFKIESDKLGLNESYNDALTLSIYIGFFIAMKEPDFMANQEKFMTRYKTHFYQLRNYLVKMSAKLSLYFEKHFQGVTTEKTHVFAYYHGKAALLSNSRRFFLYTMYNKFTIPQDEDRIQRYIKFLSKCLISEPYKNRLDRYKSKLLRNSSPFFMKTLRMCNFDLDLDTAFVKSD